MTKIIVCTTSKLRGIRGMRASFLKFYIYYYHYLKQSTLYNMRVKMKILGRFLLDGEGESGSGDNPRL